MTHRGDARHTEVDVTALGLVASSFATIQIDLNAVHRETGGSVTEATFCDHNCTTSVNGVPSGGKYDCPAALSLNKGFDRQSVAPTDVLIQGLRSTIDGIKVAQREFLAQDLPEYFHREAIPKLLQPSFTEALTSGQVVVNLFGGSPETHPGVLDIITALHSYGAEVHLTTTGRRILLDAAFREDFLIRPPDVLGLAADDFESPEEIDLLFDMSYEQLSRLWRSTPWQHGQRRKAIEAVQLCKLAESRHFPDILFNVVLHAGNLHHAPQILDRLSARTNHTVLLNPYPAQSAFLGKPGDFSEADLKHLGDFVDTAIESHLRRVGGGKPRWNLTRRFGYWLMLRAALDVVSNDVIKERISGDGVWQCYTRPGAGRCVQIGIHQSSIETAQHPGGHLGCFWNTTTFTDPRQVWGLGSADIAHWLRFGRQAAAVRSEHPCKGCLFPRIIHDAVSLEIGMTEAVAEAYRATRKRHLGY